MGFLFRFFDEQKPLITMSNTPIKMNKLRQIIRLYCQGTGTKTINGIVGTSRTTIKKYLRIWHELRITHEEFNSRSDSELAVLFNTTTAKTINSPRMQELELLDQAEFLGGDNF
jgi:hypothetical protein